MRHLALAASLLGAASAAAQCPTAPSLRGAEPPTGDRASAALRARDAAERAEDPEAPATALLGAARAMHALARHSGAREDRAAAVRLYARFLQRAGADGPGADVALYGLAGLLFRADQPGRARVVLHRLVRAHPHSDRVGHAYALLGDEAGDPNAAIAFYDRAAASSRGALRAYVDYRSAWAHHALGQAAEARGAWARARRDPSPALAAALRRDACAFR